MTFAVLVVALALALPWRWSADLGLPFALIPVLGLIGMRMGTPSEIVPELRAPPAAAHT